ncbi:MAG: hypothetical protein IPP85_16925 [Propionivibrio sp.]|nr:hypothetical protein [Propionivibrio sp.]
MKSRTRKVLHYLFAAAFGFFSVATLATPKAAEHEDAPVTSGANVARPKHSTTPAKQQVTGNTRMPPKGSRRNRPGRLTKPEQHPERNSLIIHLTLC